MTPWASRRNRSYASGRITLPAAQNGICATAQSRYGLDRAVTAPLNCDASVAAILAWAAVVEVDTVPLIEVGRKFLRIIEQ